MRFFQEYIRKRKNFWYFSRIWGNKEEFVRFFCGICEKEGRIYKIFQGDVRKKKTLWYFARIWENKEEYARLCKNLWKR